MTTSNHISAPVSSARRKVREKALALQSATGEVPRFIHLRAHSAFSLSAGAIPVKDLIKLAVKNNMPALAITDTHNLFGSLEFSLACKDAGIQPIVGVVLAVEEETSRPGKPETSLLPVLAKNEIGYQNLLKIISRSYLESGETVTPIVRLDTLGEYSDGLIAFTGGADGVLGKFLQAGQLEAARARLEKLQDLFPDRLYIELMRHGLPEEKATELHFIDLAYEYDIPLVATNDVYFATPDMHEAHDALICIAEGRYVSEENRKRFTREHYFKSPMEMAALFADIPEALLNTEVIAKRCAVMSEARQPILPNFPTSAGRTQEEELAFVAHEGLKKRLAEEVLPLRATAEEKTATEKEYIERLDFELSVINRMKYAGYFLIVSDFIRWAKSSGIPVGPGRGSGAGSVVAWSTQITNLDPIRFGLLFERFLNPERVSMPDFDIDFCQERRDEVIRYVQEKYGRENVAQIITFGKLQARAVLRDVGRVMQLPYSQVDRICKLIPFNPANPITLKEAIGLDKELQRERDKDESIRKLLDMGLRLEGLYRHASTHAAGVVIADRPLDQLIPLYYDPRTSMPVTQYAMKQAEQAGLVKFDFLGLKTLTLIDRACRLIREAGTDIDIERIPFDDKATFEMLARGDATGVFQMESAGMRDALRKMRPDTIEDIIALISLYRPGPMENIPMYVARKHGREKVDYMHPKLEAVLKETFGVIIYQEQVMQIAQILSGYTLGGADLLRRAMGKKIKEEMEAQRDQFVKGAVAQGVNEKQATHIFDLVDKFAGYGFNKSHAAAYAVIGYQTAYLKANYPVEFYTASMNIDIGDTDKINLFRREAMKAGITILPPDINRSGAEFITEKLNPPPPTGRKRAIRYALGALKGVGLAAMQVVEKERRAQGDFKNVFEVAERCDSRALSKRQLESMAKAGVFDSLNPNRKQMFEAATLLSRYGSAVQEEKDSQQVNLFGGSSAAPVNHPALPEIADWNGEERPAQEFDAMGFYLTAHPLEDYQETLERLGFYNILGLEEKITGAGNEIKLAGMPTAISYRLSGGRKFAYLQLSDPSGVIEIAIFDEEMLTEKREVLEGKKPLIVTVDAKKDEGGLRLFARHVGLLDTYLDERPQHLVLQLSSTKGLPALRQTLASCGKGRVRVALQVDAGGMLVTIQLPEHYAIPRATLSEIKSTAGVAKLLSA